MQENDIRYSAHTSLKKIGPTGQKKLQQCSILIVGIGGLGCAAAYYLTASGIGRIGLIDDDRVSLSNLQRQILYDAQDIGRLKTTCAKEKLYDLNNTITIEPYAYRLNESNSHIIKEYDIIIDTSDNFDTRFMINATCYQLKKPMISGAAIGFLGQAALFKPFVNNNLPCYHCLYPKAVNTVEPDLACHASGVVSPLVGIIGSFQAQMAINFCLALDTQQTWLYRFCAQTLTTKRSLILKDKSCSICYRI